MILYAYLYCCSRLSQFLHLINGENANFKRRWQIRGDKCMLNVSGLSKTGIIGKSQKTLIIIKLTAVVLCKTE